MGPAAGRPQRVEKWIDDHITGSDDPPSVSLSDSGPSASVPQPARGARQTPSPGGGGGGGTSSARPSDLRSFAAGNRSADAELLGLAGQLQGQCGDFAAACRWATLDASGSILGLREWLRLNGEDSDWAITVAGAFQRAGSEAVVSALSNSTIEAALRAHHVAATRRDIEVDPPTGYGSPPTTGYSNDPVNTSTGNFTETEPDLTFPGIAAPLQLTRHYNSLDAAVVAFGRGWTSWAEVALRADADVARLRLPDGREIAFPRLGDGWDRAVGGVAGMAGAGVAAARAGARTGMSCLGRNVMTGAAAGAAGGGVSGGMSYATSGQQMTAAGCSPKCPVQPASPPAPTCCSVTAPPSRSKTSPSATTYSPPTRRPVRRSRPEPKPSKRCRHLSPEEPGWRADAERPSGAEAT